MEITRTIRSALGSRRFFWIVVGFFVVQAAWIAFSARYPQAFDEQFHFGIIQVYAQHWLPFLHAQPPDANPFGAVARDPSFFYHYAMSFPYRLIELFTHNQITQIIILRLIDIALFVLGLLLFRRVLRRTGLSELSVNVAMCVMTLIPVAPQLAGQINYDNLLMPLTACACLLTFNLIDQLRQRRFTIQVLVGLLTVCLLASIVKYEFLPIFLGITLFLAIFSWRQLQGHWALAYRHVLSDWQKSGRVKWLVVAGFAVVFVLFAQRDLGNLVLYHKVVPDCSHVLNIRDCSAYGVWTHDYQSHQAVVDHDAHANPNPIFYVVEWAYWLWYRLFFAINGPASSFQNYPPLPLPAAAFAIVVLTSAVALVKYGRRTFAGQPYLAVLGVIVAVYSLTLLGDGYLKYLETGVLELMNGRYMLPILLPGVAIAVPALSALTRNLPRKVVYASIAVVLLCFLDGGGVLTFILRSDHSWYWQNTTAQHLNDTARKVLGPVVFDGPRYYFSGFWFFN